MVVACGKESTRFEKASWETTFTFFPFFFPFSFLNLPNDFVLKIIVLYHSVQTNISTLLADL